MILVSLQSIKYHFLIPTAMKLDEKTYLQLVCRFYLKIKFNTFHFTNFIYFNVIFFSAFAHCFICDNLSNCPIYYGNQSSNFF